jgi:tyrosinase
MHGLSRPAWCQHGTQLFLPWHRAYLYYFELALQSRLGPRFTITEPQNAELADVGIPWWDWASVESHADGLPQSYTDTANTNPLVDAEVGVCAGNTQLITGVWSDFLTQIVRQNTNLSGTISDSDPPKTLRDPDDPDDLPAELFLQNNVMDEGTFAGFSDAMEDIHGAVHVWVGGAMSQVPTAAYDPIFWSHHSMIDRLWYIWQNSQNGINPPASLMNVVLTPFPMTVAQTMDIIDLRYEYAVQAH